LSSLYAFFLFAYSAILYSDMITLVISVIKLSGTLL